MAWKFYKELQDFPGGVRNLYTTSLASTQQRYHSDSNYNLTEIEHMVTMDVKGQTGTFHG